MRSKSFILCGVLLALVACKKEEPVLKASFHATCRSCIVAYAVGPEQSHKDTLKGVVDPISGIPALVEGSWEVELKDGDNLFLTGCQLDSVFHGDIELTITGDISPLSATATTDSCAEINAPAQGK